MTGLPADYAERVYAGVLGKAIGVYLGRPVEGWRHETIERLVGEIAYYVNDRDDVALKNHRLVVPDDDITGTLTFVRAIEDSPQTPPDAAQVGAAWLNYIVPDRTVLWWGGRGMSTEHTAYLNLQAGMQPPRTGAASVNGQVAAEQVGGQIFAEGWALACPGDPERAAALAATAASVSHDGEALEAARVVAALVAYAFVEVDVDTLLDTATALIGPDSLIRQVIDDVREWCAASGDWRDGFARIDRTYGYDRYPGNCHVVPNHALLVNALVHGRGDFSRGLGIVVSCGWDTDSNAGNLGCIAGVRGGLAGIDAGRDWRTPVADRIYLPTADGSAAITDAVRESVRIVNYGHRLHDQPPWRPKDGARFHFSLSGSVQGFRAEPAGATRVVNRLGANGEHGLIVDLPAGGAAVHAMTPTFLTPDTLVVPPYGQSACPTLHSGQQLTARVVAGRGGVRCRAVVRVYDGADQLREVAGPTEDVSAGASAEISWRVPDTGGQPIGEVGLALAGTGPAADQLFLDRLTWTGSPDVSFTRPVDGGTMWRHAWVDAADHFTDHRTAHRVIQDHGTGLIIQGGRDWRDYRVRAEVIPWLVRSAGLAARVQGLRRYYALRLRAGGGVELIRVLDGVAVLAAAEFAWEPAVGYGMTLAVADEHIQAAVRGPDGAVVELQAQDRGTPLTGGGIALVIEEGHLSTDCIRVEPWPQRQLFESIN